MRAGSDRVERDDLEEPVEEDRAADFAEEGRPDTIGLGIEGGVALGGRAVDPDLVELEFRRAAAASGDVPVAKSLHGQGREGSPWVR